MQYLARVSQTIDSENAIGGVRMDETMELPDRQVIYRDWIVRGMEITGKSRTAFFKEAGLDASTGSRAFDKKSPSRIRDDTIDRLAIHWKIAPPELLVRGRNGAIFETRQPDIVPLSASAAEPGLDEGLSQWEVQTRVLELAGYVPGDVVTVSTTAPPRNGDAVLAVIHNISRGITEHVFRRFKSGRAPYLVVSTADPAALDAEPEYVDNDRVKIVGAVVEMVRKRPA